jgi:phosphopantothenoylcysteine decarboxylase/phosphopantothenate--cysteine ligase
MSSIVVGIGGGIAAYKMATVVSRLVQQGHKVRVVLTRGGRHFVGDASFAALCGQAPVSDTYDPHFPLGPHIELAADLDLLVIAPATARLLAACAQGAADDLLSTLYLNCECPVLFAPAMSSPMWDKPAVQRNVEQLRRDGGQFVGPESGWLSCRKLGTGRLAEPDSLLKVISDLLEAEH